PDEDTPAAIQTKRTQRTDKADCLDDCWLFDQISMPFDYRLSDDRGGGRKSCCRASSDTQRDRLQRRKATVLLRASENHKFLFEAKQALWASIHDSKVAGEVVVVTK
ncbi:hypothetical protein THAOC_11941, partial [Thalassiosira oceanica]